MHVFQFDLIALLNYMNLLRLDLMVKNIQHKMADLTIQQHCPHLRLLINQFLPSPPHRLLQNRFLQPSLPKPSNLPLCPRVLAVQGYYIEIDKKNAHIRY